MVCTTALESELDKYFAWLTQFEASIPAAHAASSRWYSGAVLQAYTRYSWFKASTPGEPAICLANFYVADELRGRGYFAMLVSRFLSGQDGLQARVLYLENIANPRFENWLLRIGFERCSATSGEFCAYYVTR